MKYITVTENKNTNRFALITMSLIPNAYLLKSFLSIGFDFTVILYLLLYIFLLFTLINTKFKMQIKLTIFDLLFYFWLLVLFIGLFYSPFPMQGAYKISKLIFMAYSLTVFIRIYVKNYNEYIYLLKSILLSSLILSVIVTINFVSLGMPFGRFSFYGAHPIPLGMMGAISSLISLYLYSSKKINIWYLAVSFLLGLIIVLLSSSKGPVLSLVAGITFFLPTYFKDLKRSTLLTLVFITIFYFISQTEQFSSLTERFVETEGAQSTIERLELYENAKNYFYHNPILGSGVGVFKDYYPHNLFLEILGEGGVLLLLILILFICIIIYKYWVYILSPFRKIKPISLSLFTASFVVLLVSYTYVDLKIMFISIGLLTIENTINSKN
ncbi:hypothetical protein CN497_15285 [Priestia megaterium]|uniref:O-antigen ligase-related domain-containing protein n=1 Tax=Priestia megaterium TaxID=1404 RepID=A0AAE5P5C5_PRIMG|nr:MULTISPECIES: O-antigen ligase family protein [Priestia]PES37223.1 hypothetical protein CN497_15285 [Priestia megaterium]WJX00625.1 O-antigen ligase family protein [Priestia aryabhattai]